MSKRQARTGGKLVVGTRLGVSGGICFDEEVEEEEGRLTLF